MIEIQQREMMEALVDKVQKNQNPVQEALRAMAIIKATREDAIVGLLADMDRIKSQLAELGYKTRGRKPEAPAKKRGRPTKVQSPVE